MGKWGKRCGTAIKKGLKNYLLMNLTIISSKIEKTRFNQKLKKRKSNLFIYFLNAEKNENK